jgi:hypothetical protein
MSINTISKLTIVSLLLLIGAACRTGQSPETLKEKANLPTTALLPKGWKSLDSAAGVVLAGKSFIRGRQSVTDYIIIADLAAGAAVKLLDSVQTGGSSPVFYTYPVTTAGGSQPSFWSLFHDTLSFAMANLAFFNYVSNQYPTAAVCYPLMYAGKSISCGGTAGTCSGDATFGKRVVKIDNSTITVSDFCPDSNYCQNISPGAGITLFVGNQPYLPCCGNNPPRVSCDTVARTYLGKKGSTLFLYTSAYASAAIMINVLVQEFGISYTDIVMFDGGGSTQMVCKGKNRVPSSDNRWVPSAIEIRSVTSR